MSDIFLRLPEVIARTGLSRSTIYEKIKSKKFPLPISLGDRAVGFIDREIDDWIEARIADSRKDAA